MNILVAVTSSEYAQKALVEAIQLAKKEGASLTLCCVAPRVGLFDDMPPTFVDKLRNEAEKVTADAQAKVAAAGLTASVDVREGTSAAEQIIGAAVQANADLIVLGHRDQSELDKLLVGSVALQVVSHAPCSVYVVK